MGLKDYTNSRDLRLKKKILYMEYVKRPVGGRDGRKGGRNEKDYHGWKKMTGGEVKGTFIGD